MTEQCPDCGRERTGTAFDWVDDPEKWCAAHLRGASGNVILSCVHRLNDRLRSRITDLEAQLAPLTAGREELKKQLAGAQAKAKEAVRQLTFATANNRQRNIELDAVGYVWCSGTCKGALRMSEESITAEHVAAAMNNTTRMLSNFVNRSGRLGEDKALEAYRVRWEAARASVASARAAELEAQLAEALDYARGYNDGHTSRDAAFAEMREAYWRLESQLAEAKAELGNVKGVPIWERVNALAEKVLAEPRPDPHAVWAEGYRVGFADRLRWMNLSESGQLYRFRQTPNPYPKEGT